MKPVINATPHPVNVIDSEGAMQVIPPCGHTVRVQQEVTLLRQHGGFDIFKMVFSRPSIAPAILETLDANPAMLCVVSRIALTEIQTWMPSIAGRFVAPGEAIKDKDGRVVGCKGFSI